MDLGSGSASSSRPPKQEDTSADDSKDGPKPAVKTLNRVPRACNACRKQKMRCEGADNPPCKRCRHAGLECVFEKPSREATLTGEAGLERIRSLESHVSEIRQTQWTIQNTLQELVSHLRNNGRIAPRSPSVMSQPYQISSPGGTYTNGSPATTVTAGPGPMSVDTHGPPVSPLTAPGIGRSRAGSFVGPQYRSPSLTNTGQRQDSSQLSPAGVQFPRPAQGPSNNSLPSISTFHGNGPRTSSSNLSYQGGYTNMQHIQGLPHKASSNVTSADSSDKEDDDNGDLPAKGLVAPWEVLRGLADVAVERAAKEQGDRSEPSSRARSPDPKHSRPTKRRKVQHNASSRLAPFPDVVTKKIVSEQEAQELFRIFYHGCSTFLPIFDSNVDTYESLHERSPFAVDCICMVAARVRDGGGPPSDLYAKILEEVQTISCATLFSPVTRPEAVQAMVLVSGWSDNGWLSGGHAVRMALELSMHKAWPKLLRRLRSGKASDSPEDRELVISSRTWFCLYLFEHQLSYGTGRPAILKDDESIWNCRDLLQHPLAIDDDMRLVSMVELMAVRERFHNELAPYDGNINDGTFETLRKADMEFRSWFATWDQAFSQKYEDAAFYRQSLQVQQHMAELFHNATALQGINGPADVQRMHPAQRQLAIRSIHIATQALHITVNSPAYCEGMKYAVHYTHVSVVFAASFLLRLARLFPDECNVDDIRDKAEKLARLMTEIPGKRYAPTLYLMLKRSKKRLASSSRSPKVREAHRLPLLASGSQVDHLKQPHIQPHPEMVSPPFEAPFNPMPQVPPHQQSQQQPQHPPPQQQHQQHGQHGQHVMPQQPQQMAMAPGSAGHWSVDSAANVEQIWRGFEMTSNEQLPVWFSDQSLGGYSFSQHGMEAFMLPAEYDPQHNTVPQIW